MRKGGKDVGFRSIVPAEQQNHKLDANYCSFLANIFFTVYSLLRLIPSEARRHRHFHQQQQQDGHFSKQNLEQVPDDGTAENGGGGGRGRQHWWKKHRRTPRIICVHGSAAGGRCVCDQGWTGTNCQREMHCATFERSQNGSCTNCQPNFFGDLCDRLECQNGGEELVEEQKCNCSKPYSGTFCDELLTKNVYYFYNSKVATLGPLGLLSVIPMIGIYVVCERFARKRQVHRIEKTWNEQSECPIHVDPAHIELLLKEKA